MAGPAENRPGLLVTIWKLTVWPDSFAGPAETLVAQLAIDCGPGREQARVVRGDGEGDGLTGGHFIGRPRQNVRRPVGTGLRTRILQRGDIRPLGKAGRVVDRRHRDGEGLRRAG